MVDKTITASKITGLLEKKYSQCYVSQTAECESFDSSEELAT